MFPIILYMRGKNFDTLRFGREGIFFLRGGPMRDLYRSKDGVRLAGGSVNKSLTIFEGGRKSITK